MILGKTSHSSVEIDVTTVESSAVFEVEYVYMFTNDGTDDIFINFDISTTESGTITVRPEEVVSDFPRTSERIYFRAKSGVQPFRAWGVK